MSTPDIILLFGPPIIIIVGCTIAGYVLRRNQRRRARIEEISEINGE